MTFAETYRRLAQDMMVYQMYNCKFTCRGLPMAKEMTAVHREIDMSQHGVSVFSHKHHRVVPIRFVLAELCYLLSGSNDLELIASYAATMRNYSNDGKTIDGAYGYRLMKQLPEMIARLKLDSYTRQACGVIYREDDIVSGKTHMPCNTFLQVLWRQPLISLHVTSRSSDFVTGFSIDSLHWQFLLLLIANELCTVPDRVIYDIATLHIYQHDMDAIGQWQYTERLGGSYEHFLSTKLQLMQAIRKCQEFFQPKMSLMELCDLLELDKQSTINAANLELLFQQHRNNIKR